MKYSAENLLFRSKLPADQPGLINQVTPEAAGWEALSVELRRLERGARFGADTQETEAVLVLLGGRCRAQVDGRELGSIGKRRSVFEGMPWALYLPPHSRFELEAETEWVELAYGWVPSQGDREVKLITPDDVAIEVRGGHGNTRQINAIVPAGFPADRIVCVEVYTPGGNWSSYPPHRHEEHREQAGQLLEADLEEVYCYRFSRPEGWAFQRVYDDRGSLDAAVVARDGDIVLVPWGYHPVAAAYGYDCYYLNFLAGSAQSLASTDDPKHAWVKRTWTGTDPRIPMVTREMEEER